MCGIVAMLGREPVAGCLLEALKRLEYRGYDSAGIATLEDGHLTRRRARSKLRAKGHQFSTETDSEVIAHLVSDAIRRGYPPVEAVAASLPELKGAFAVALIFEGEEELLIGARRGAPLVAGIGQGDHEGQMFLASDALALAPFVGSAAYLEEGDFVVLTRNGAKFHDSSGTLVERHWIRPPASAMLIDKGNYRHFMAKEIHEQPEVVGRTLAHYLNMSEGRVALPFELPVDAAKLSRLTI